MKTHRYYADRVLDVRRALNVKRYHQEFTHREDTVGSHSAGVALFIMLMVPNASAELLKAALTHDLGELVTGDIPAPSKRALSDEARLALSTMEDTFLARVGFPEAAQLSQEDHLLLKIADYLDGLSFVIEEVVRGNRSILHVGDNYHTYLTGLMQKARDMGLETHEIICIVNAVTDRWENLQ